MASRLLIASIPVGALLLGAACNLDAKRLVQGYDPQTGQPPTADVIDLDLDENKPSAGSGVYLGELGPANVGAGVFSGATLTIEGTGGRICVLIDPQTVWRDDEMIDPEGNLVTNHLMNDYPYDDGDLDMQVGLASYYTGTPGAVMGDFVSAFPDSNGVERRVDLNLCLQRDYHGQPGGTGGRGTPEFCSLETVAGTPYRIALTVFSVPIDDDLLKYALEIREGACPLVIDECTLRGDADFHDDAGLPFGTSSAEDLYCFGAD